MEKELPEDVRKARSLLEEFERSSSHSKKIRYFENGINILDDYLEDFPQSPHKEFIMNIKLAYTRTLINQLNKIRPDMDEWVDYISLLFSKVKKEVDRVQETNPDLKANYEDFINLWANELIEETRKMEKQVSAIRRQLEKHA
jgi:hypothetical protein